MGSQATLSIYGLLAPAATPAFSPSPGTYNSAQSVAISDSSSGTTIYYTTNGSTPTTSSTVYTGPIQVSTTTTIKAIAAGGGLSASAVASATYTINLPAAAAPNFSPAAGTYNSAHSVTISDSSSGTTI
ncbi:MAG: chitobiase/beta-hexosaminidase C-terminal domain-containing protein, partial [Bryobacteraceae bacterium]